MRVSLLLSLSLVSWAMSLPAWSAEPMPADREGYQVIMWVLGGIPENQDLFFHRLHELNVSAIHIGRGDSPEPARQHGFDFYVENIHRIGFLHEAHRVYQADWDGYTKSRDKRFLVRKPCLHDPGYLAQAKEILQTTARQYVGTDPLLYDIGDECSITSFASPMDYCFSEFTLARFRDWLKEQYGTLARLNEEWETSFAGWEEVAPMTTYEIKDREKKGSENYSPWADHRTFMDITYATTVDQFRRWLHEVDPKTPAGLEGTQMPAAFGGYDLWRLSQAVDWVEPYDIGGSHAIFRSFLPPRAPVYATVFEHDAKPASRRLWHLLLNGDRGNIIWCSSDWFDYKSPELTPKPWVAGMAELFAELRGPAARAIMEAKRDRAQIAILYSHPSVQAGWMIDSRVDGDTWPRRFSSYESEHSVVTRVREAWMKLLEDLGLQYDFVSSQQVEQGDLGKLGYKVLVLPASLAISEKEAAQIKAFVRGGGSVIADFLPGVFDEHAKRRKQGVLDSFFGVTRPSGGMIEQPEKSQGRGFRLGGETIALGPAEPKLGLLMGNPAAMLDNAPVLLERSLDKGRTLYLNISPIDYPGQRAAPWAGQLRKLVGEFISKAGVRPPATVVSAETGEPPVGCEVIGYQGEGRRYLAVARDPHYQVSGLGEIKYAESARPDRPAPLVVEFPATGRVRELLSGRDFGETKRVEVTLDPWKPVVLEVRR
jgi:hypothetical protein